MSQMDLDIESMIQGKKGILMRIIINNTTLDLYGFICDICDTVTTLQREGIFYVTGEKVLSVTACDKNKTHREFFICRFPLSFRLRLRNAFGVLMQRGKIKWFPRDHLLPTKNFLECQHDAGRDSEPKAKKRGAESSKNY